MRDWHCSLNCMYKKASLHVIEMPLWLWCIEWFADRGCSFVPAIPFPKFPKITIKEDDGTSFESTPREYYGDLSQWFCGYVDMPITQWVFTHKKRQEFSIDIDYDTLKEKLKNHKHTLEFFERQEKEMKEWEEKEKLEEQKEKKSE